MEPETSGEVQDYSFESYENKFARQKNHNVDADIDTLIRRFGLDVTPSEDERDVFYRYVVAHHCAIAWYLNSITKNLKSQNAYFWVSVALLAALPFAVIGAPWLFSALSADGTAAQIGVQVTAVLTGAFAAHRALSTWLEKRTNVARFWEASAKLKGQLYDLENNWRGHGSVSHRVNPNLIVDMRLGIRAAQRIVEEEQREFFLAMTLTKIDLGASLKDAMSQARDVNSIFANPELAHRTELEKAHNADESKAKELRRKLVQLDEEISAYGDLISRRNRELAHALSENDQESLRSEIKVYRQGRNDKETERVRVRAELMTLV